MSIKCSIGLHSWAGCRCSGCAKTQDKDHDWNKDCESCSTCGKIRVETHKWAGCKCSRCGKIRDEAHDWTKNCETCSKCGKTRTEAHEWAECKCSKCGATRNYDHDWSTVGPKCSACGTQNPIQAMIGRLWGPVSQGRFGKECGTNRLAQHYDAIRKLISEGPSALPALTDYVRLACSDEKSRADWKSGGSFLFSGCLTAIAMIREHEAISPLMEILTSKTVNDDQVAQSIELLMWLAYCMSDETFEQFKTKVRSAISIRPAFSPAALSKLDYRLHHLLEGDIVSAFVIHPGPNKIDYEKDHWRRLDNIRKYHAETFEEYMTKVEKCASQMFNQQPNSWDLNDHVTYETPGFVRYRRRTGLSDNGAGSEHSETGGRLLEGKSIMVWNRNSRNVKGGSRACCSDQEAENMAAAMKEKGAASARTQSVEFRSMPNVLTIQASRSLMDCARQLTVETPSLRGFAVVERPDAWEGITINLW